MRLTGAKSMTGIDILTARLTGGVDSVGAIKERKNEKDEKNTCSHLQFIADI